MRSKVKEFLLSNLLRICPSLFETYLNMANYISTKNSLWKSIKPFLPNNAIQKFNQPRRQRQREGQKSKSFRLAKQKLCTCITVFCTFLSRRCTTTTYKCLISGFVEDGNTIQQLPISFPELWYNTLAGIQLKKKFQDFTNPLFKWRFRSRRRRCCLSSQYYQAMTN